MRAKATAGNKAKQQQCIRQQGNKAQGSKAMRQQGNKAQGTLAHGTVAGGSAAVRQ